MKAKPSYDQLLRKVRELEAESAARRRVEAELQKALRFTESLLMAVPTPVFFKDAAGRYQGCNPAFTEIMGVTAEEMRGKTVYELWPSEHAVVYHEKDLEVMRKAEHQTYEFKVKDKDGNERPVIFNKDVFLNEDGEVAGLVGSFLDITERKMAEETLKKLNANLEAQVAERTAKASQRALQLQHLALELSNAEDKERQRIASLLHEDLQQYLVTIKLRLEVLADHIEPDSEPAANLRSIQTLLAESIQKTRHLSYELSPPRRLRNDLRAAIEWLARDVTYKHGIEVSTRFYLRKEPLDTRDCNSLLFRSIRELLLNVVKHSGVKSAGIEVREKDVELQVCVRDSGHGFDYAALKQQGVLKAGFGLFSIEERIDFLGGRMEIESAPGKGCCVTLRIPGCVRHESAQPGC